MKVLVDTCIWSLAFRRKKNPENKFTLELVELIKGFNAQIIGPIRQEVLSGIHEQSQFERLRNHLNAFPDLQITKSDYINAAKFFNLSRSRGVQGSNTDFLICAVAKRHNMPIFTADKDFFSFQEYFPIKLHVPRD